MKKNMAITMAGLMSVAAVVPAFASEKQEVVSVNLDIINGEVEASREEIAIETAKLDKVKSTLKTMSEATYVDGQDDKGNDIIRNTYKIESKKGTVDEETKKFDATVTSTNLVNGEVYVVEFKGAQTLDPDFGKPEGDIAENITINYTDTNYASKMAKIKKAVKEEDLSYKVTFAEKKSEVSDRANYKVVLTSNLSKKVVANITINNAPIAQDDVVVLPGTSDFMNHWAKENIEAAMLNKWVDNSETFRPNAEITRAEFVKVVNRAFGLEVSQNMPRMAVDFEDVNTRNWFYGDIVTAVNAGYINGYDKVVVTTDGNGNEVATTVKEFRPNQPITRQEAAKIVSTLLNDKNLDGEGLNVDIKTDFADDAKIANWADQSVQSLVDNKVTNGYADNTFRPQNKITRAEALVMMDRAVSVK